MVKENILEIIKEIEKLCHMTSTLEDIKITPGYFSYTTKRFVPSTEKIEDLCFTWGGQSLEFGECQSIAGDNGYGIMIDVIKALRRMV